MFISYSDLNDEQGKSLDYKIEKAVEAIEDGFRHCKHTPAMAFSGGKDSTVLWDLMRRYFPQEEKRLHIIYGNTGVEYPESLQFARWLGREWGGERFHEVRPLRTEKDGLKYEAQCMVLSFLERMGRLDEVLKPDGKLKRTGILEEKCPKAMWKYFERKHLIWKAGTMKSYFWCADQYGWPLLGKSFSKLKAHRINIDCFLKYSQSQSKKPELLAYYDILRDVKISQCCCDILKKEPSEKMQADLDVDVIFKGLMAAESRTRQTNFCSRGYLFQSRREHLPEGDSFWHCNPISVWTDADIWAYIHRFGVPYSPLYDMGWEDEDGEFHKIPRNGCMACGTDLLYPNNHLATLRRTHPAAWKAFMKSGLAEEIRNLQQAKRGGQFSVMDFIGDANYLVETRPCAFDRIDRLVLEDITQNREMREYDPEEDSLDDLEEDFDGA